MRGEFALGGDVALPDAGALNDPLIGGVDPRCQFGIGQYLPRQIAAAAEHHRTYRSHETASGAVDHLIANIDRIGKAFGVGSAVALDHDTVQAEEHTAI